jgi:hypothetical protein
MEAAHCINSFYQQSGDVIYAGGNNVVNQSEE